MATDTILNALLIHSCDIQRKSVTGVDGGGLPVTSWANLATSVSCRFEPLELTSTSREIHIGSQIMIAEYIVYFVSSQDITEKDRLVVASGDFAATYSAELVRKGTDDVDLHHIEAFVRTVR